MVTTAHLFRAVARVLDSATALQHAPQTPIDSVVVASPLPGGVARVVRFLFNAVPAWVQVGGAILGALVALGLIAFVVIRRRRIASGIAAQSRAMKLALAGSGVVVLAAGGTFGMASWNYSQHDNAFCTGCHIMNPAFQRFSSNENKHEKLSCHNCHQQSLFASARQMYLWTAERPEKIGAHSKVPNAVCVTCHVTGDTAKWQRIASTAGHRVHLESDSSVLKNVQCVTCHGVELHRFKAVSETCGQTNCHKPSETAIVLGKMAQQTVFHCTGCHAFTADVPLLATRDSARGTLVPGKPQCLGCHEMQKALPDFNTERDPHKGKCGTCHNAHTQTTPQAALKSCTNAGCHNQWREEPFHVGSHHKNIGERCITCHVPHSAKVDASDCAGCHERIRATGNLRPPVRFDTTKALKRGGGDPQPDPGGAGTPTADGDTTPEPDDSGVDVSVSAPAAIDSFPHARHVKLACLVCHSTGTGHGSLTFERPRGCSICHHQAPATNQCATCHKPDALAAPRPLTVTVTVAHAAPRPRTVGFRHERHTKTACIECHTAPVTLAVAPARAQCADCHTSHHAADRDCSHCHQVADPVAAHRAPQFTHQQCDACHVPRTIELLTPTRSLCATCHAAQRATHYATKECTVCHFLMEPSAFRARLMGAPAK